MTIKFLDQYKVGLEEIDAQHLELFIRINELYDVCLKNDNSKDIKIAIEAFEESILFHIQKEEDYMVKFHYNRIITHKKEHENIKGILLEAKSIAQKTSLTSYFIIEVLFILTNWILLHFKYEDALLAEFLKTKIIV